MSQTAPYRVVRYSAELRDRFIDLGCRIWGRDREQSARYFEWKYLDNPWAGETPDIYLVLAGNVIVGSRGFYRSRWESGLGAERVVETLPVADDFYIEPAHRGLGLASLLMREALGDLGGRERYVLNLSGSLVTVLGSLAMGWRSAGQQEPIGLGKASLRRRFRDALGRLRFFWRFGDSRWLLAQNERWPYRRLDREGGAGPITVQQTPPVAALCELVERIGHDGRIRHVRDAESLTWRYRCPLGSYRFLCYGSGPIEGCLVLQVPVPYNGVPARIVDLVATSAPVRRALLERALDTGRFRRCFAWSATLPADAVDLLTARGWHPIDQLARAHGAPCILVKQLQGGSPPETWKLGPCSLTERDSWDVRMIDTMAG